MILLLILGDDTRALRLSAPPHRGLRLSFGIRFSFIFLRHGEYSDSPRTICGESGTKSKSPTFLTRIGSHPPLLRNRS